MKFHLDENVDVAIGISLRARGIDVTLTREVSMLASTDEAQLAFALREGRVIVTHDPDLLRLAASGARHAGIAFCAQPQDGRIGWVVLALVELARKVPAERMAGEIQFLSPLR